MIQLYFLALNNQRGHYINPCLVLIHLEFRDIGFCDGEKTRVTGEIPSEPYSKTKTNNKVNSCMTHW